MTRPAVVVWCDDASHPARRTRVFVAEYVKPNIAWMPLPQKRRQPGVKWWADTDGSNTHVEPDAGRWALTHHTMACRWCKRPVTVRVGKLDSILDQVYAAGRVHTTLAELRAILGTSPRRP